MSPSSAISVLAERHRNPAGLLARSRGMIKTISGFLLSAMLIAAAPSRHAAAADADRSIAASEKSMWEMWKRKDAASFGNLLAADFQDIYLSGEMAGKRELLKGFYDADLIDYRLGAMNTVALSPDVRLLTYRAHVHGRVAKKEIEYDVDVTSVWAIRRRQWKSVFYRENLVPKTLPWQTLAS
jgi:hypothetical protein